MNAGLNFVAEGQRWFDLVRTKSFGALVGRLQIGYHATRPNITCSPIPQLLAGSVQAAGRTGYWPSA